MASARVSTAFILISAILFSIASFSSAIEAEKEHVLNLDHYNFSEIVSKHKFIVVEFYAPWYTIVSSIYYSFFMLYRFDLI
ncbi:putative protein disulfide-isomerase [Helianthus annuus]|nr:putative protein disulfide-isomerase [Helianthus annuus]